MVYIFFFGQIDGAVAAANQSTGIVGYIYCIHIYLFDGVWRRVAFENGNRIFWVSEAGTSKKNWRWICIRH